ncbi:DNA cross-link repair 1A protein-like isoform X2 [Momordica charantia]|uniref:DNA cross-link repair 1A protein-like isoform X2 n=1 Tax=Momordica charantia TaxID=3673 RepID=A0A6J1CG29_MOMCH|nr:DNA cross-link repair 1A protein-like isoform X2 [Momordica charantia]
MPLTKSAAVRHQKSASQLSQFHLPTNAGDDDDGGGDFLPSTQTVLSSRSSSSQKPLATSELSSLHTRAPKRPKRSTPTAIGKENIPSIGYGYGDTEFKLSSMSFPDAVSGSTNFDGQNGAAALDGSEAFGLSEIDLGCSLDFIEPSIVGCSYQVHDANSGEEIFDGVNGFSGAMDECKGSKVKGGYLCNSIESRLMNSRVDRDVGISGGGVDKVASDDFESDTELDLLLNLHSQVDEEDHMNGVRFGTEETDFPVDEEGLIQCPLCGVDISDLSDKERQVHTNDCIDQEDVQAQNVALTNDRKQTSVPQQSGDNSRLSTVLKWLHGLGLSKYEDIFIREEIDWAALQWLTDEDLIKMGITALGPRRKITHALSELRKDSCAVETCTNSHAPSSIGQQSNRGSDGREGSINGANKTPANKLITDYFPGFASDKKNSCSIPSGQKDVEKKLSDSSHRGKTVKRNVKNGKLGNVPVWSCIPGTPFRVDAFRHLRGDCFHWFLTHFHMDHYQGLTKSFRHGMIYCSPITAKLVNMKIGIPWERLQVLPLDQKINIAGIDVTCFDANHCPGSIIILFEPPNGKAVLHTGDFRFCEEIGSLPVFQTCRIHTLILDTTYCDPQYDFPKQETVIQFVIDAIQAEAFNPKTLFLIGCYTIGKERLFLEVARVLRKKVYVTAAKLRILKCLGFSEEDMQWFTVNEWESHIHVVPLWTLASFKRLKHVSNQYANRFSLVVAFSPTGWALSKGKKKSPGRRWQQGTIIRYEVPYSEHSSFSELEDFVKLVSPANIIPSVNNHGPDSARAMISLLSPLCGTT